MVRAFGALCSDENCYLHSLWRAEGPIYTSLGQRPRNGDNNAIEGLKARSMQVARQSGGGFAPLSLCSPTYDPFEMYKLQTTRLRAWLRTAGASRLSSSPAR